MSLLSGISVLTQSLRNFEAAVKTSDHNIANVGTLGFSRQVINYTTNTPLAQNGYFLGQGANVSSVARVRDSFLDIQIRNYISEQAYYDTLTSSLKQLAAVFPDILVPSSTSGIFAKTDAFYTSWSDLALDPTNVALKKAVIDRGVDLAQELRTASLNLGSLRNSLNVEVGNKIREANGLMHQIATLNKSIMQIPASSGIPNDLLDARDLALSKLSKIIEVTTVSTTKRSIDVLFEQGPLVQGGEVSRLFAINRSPDPELFGVGYRGDLTTANDVTRYFTRGELGALLEARDVIVEDAIFNVSAFGTGLIENTNFVYAAGEDSALGHINFFQGINAQSILVTSSLALSPTGAELITAYQDPATVLPFVLDPAGLAKDMAALKNMYSANFIQSFGAIRSPFPPTPAGNIFDIDMALGNGSAALAGPYPFFPTPLTVPTVASGQMGRMHIDVSPTSGVIIEYNENTTLLEIVQAINVGLAGAAIAAYNEQTGEFTLLTSQPLSVYDEDISIGNLASAMRLSMSLNSATNVNSTVDLNVRAVDKNDALNSQNALLNYFKAFSEGGGSFSLDNTIVNWLDTDTLSGVLSGNIPFADPSLTGDLLDQSDFINTQRAEINRTAGAATLANPVRFFEGADVSGNFLQNLAIGKSTTILDRYESLREDLTIRQSVGDANKLGADATLQQLETLQADKSAVNLDEEMARAMAYQRSYEASIRVLSVLDQMLNVLINGTASPSTNLSSSRS